MTDTPSVPLKHLGLKIVLLLQNPKLCCCCWISAHLVVILVLYVIYMSVLLGNGLQGAVKTALQQSSRKAKQKAENKCIKCNFCMWSVWGVLNMLTCLTCLAFEYTELYYLCLVQASNLLNGLNWDIKRALSLGRHQFKLDARQHGTQA